jgi:hypothetical protein
MNVEMTNISYIRLANNRLAISGNCTRCSAKLLKTRVMPISGITKRNRLFFLMSGRVLGGCKD